MDELRASLWLSLRVALCATAVVALVIIPLGYLAARRRFAGKSLVEALLLAPLVLPPTVVGYLLIVLLGARGLLGRRVLAATGYSLIFSFGGAVLAAAVVALPMLYLPARAGFA